MKEKNLNESKEYITSSLRITVKAPKKGVKTKRKEDFFEYKSFNDICNEFTTILQMLWQYMIQIGSVAEATTFTNIAGIPPLIKEIIIRKKKSKKKEKPLGEIRFEAKALDETGKEDITAFSTDVYEAEHLEKLKEFSQYHYAAYRILIESAIQQIANAWEQLLGEILRCQFFSDPDSINKEREISYKELLSFNSLDQAKRNVIDKEIENFIKFKSSEEQIRYLKNELKADLYTHFKELPRLIEFILRRHAFAHAGGVATSEYIRRVKKIKGFKIDGNIIENQKIPSNLEYVKNAWNVIYAAGVILLHLVSKNCARIINSKEDEDRADSFLIKASFANIKNKQYHAAELILEYAKSLHLVKEMSNLIVAVNLAQTYKWQNKEELCNQILVSIDWNACSNLFQLCVAALREDIKTFKKLLPYIPHFGKGDFLNYGH